MLERSLCRGLFCRVDHALRPWGRSTNPFHDAAGRRDRRTRSAPGRRSVTEQDAGGGFRRPSLTSGTFRHGGSTRRSSAHDHRGVPGTARLGFNVLRPRKSGRVSLSCRAPISRKEAGTAPGDCRERRGPSLRGKWGCTRVTPISSKAAHGPNLFRDWLSPESVPVGTMMVDGRRRGRRRILVGSSQHKSGASPSPGSVDAAWIPRIRESGGKLRSFKQPI